MKTVFAIFLMLTIPLAAGADLCVKQNSHTDSYYYGGVTNPSEDEESVMWISADKVAVTGETRSVIIDLPAKSMFFINHNDSTYAEMTLPMDWSQVVDPQLLARLNMFKRQGEIKATEEKKKIGEWECEGYEVSSWIPYMDTRFDEREMTVWVTEDVPIDLGKYNEMTTELYKLRNYSDAMIEEMKKIEGVEVASEGVIYMRGFTVNTEDKLIEMFEEDPPPDVYSVPKGYSKKDILTIQDLRG